MCENYVDIARLLYISIPAYLNGNMSLAFQNKIQIVFQASGIQYCFVRQMPIDPATNRNVPH